MKEVKRNVRKLDAKGLIGGVPAYTDDLVPPNALVVKVLRSPYAHARIERIDTSSAFIPGVACILDWRDVPRVNMSRAGQGYPEPSPYDKYILDEVVRYVGDEVAIVAAIDEKTALEALERIHVVYQELPAVLDADTAEGNDTIIHPEPDARSMFPIGMDPQKNLAAAYQMEVGSVEHCLSGCDVVIRERFQTQAQAHAMMEPHSAVSWLDVNHRLVVTTSTQTPFHVRRIIAHTFGMPTREIRVIKPRVGGGYGGKQAIHGELIVAAVTLKTGRPARLVYTRKEVFESTYTRHPMRIDIALGADKDGTLRAIDMQILSNTGAYGEHALTVLMVAGSKTLPLYNKVDAVRFSGKVVYTNTTPAGAFRGYGAIQGNFALESAIDILADKLGITPEAIRRRNMIKEGETSPIFRIMGEGGEGVAMTVESCKLAECMDIGLKQMQWDDKIRQIDMDKAASKLGMSKCLPEKVRGLGMAIAMQGSGIPAIDMASAILKLNDDGFFNLTIGATDIGTGSDTILAQIAAEVLQVPTEDIHVYSSDTDLTPFDTGAYASSTTYVSGHAVRKAAEQMRDLLLDAAAERLEQPLETIEFDGTNFICNVSKATISLKDLSTGLFYSNHQKQLVSSGSFVGHKSPPPYMAAFAEVEVDTGTGQVNVVDYVAVVDCGTTINPNLARIQVEGGLAQGIGLALYEEAKRDAKGKLINNSFLTYQIPTREEIQQLRVSFVESYEPTGPFGAKSVGEIGIDTPPAAIANAIYNATGLRLTDLPFTPEKVLMALKAKKESFYA